MGVDIFEGGDRVEYVLRMLKVWKEANEVQFETTRDQILAMFCLANTRIMTLIDADAVFAVSSRWAR